MGGKPNSSIFLRLVTKSKSKLLQQLQQDVLLLGKDGWVQDVVVGFGSARDAADF